MAKLGIYSGLAVAGETVDSCEFHSVAFVGVYAPEVILVMIGSQILIKTLYEIVMYPITRKVLLAVRHHAGVDGMGYEVKLADLLASR